MMQVNSRISAIFLISIFLFPQSIQLTKGCGGWDQDDTIDTSMFIPEIIPETRFDPFFLSIWDYYNPTITEGRIAPNSNDINDHNMDEWQAYFSNITKEQVYQLVYKQSIAAMDSFLLVCDKKILNPEEPFQFAFGKTSLKDGFDYLKNAKKVEQQLYTDAWGGHNASFDPKKLNELSKEMLTKYRSISNKSIRMRYGFQYVRICHALNSFDEGIRFADAEYRFNPSEGFMYYRTMGYKAACYYRLKQYDQANIIYARLYDLGEAFKFEAFQSFHPQSELEFKNTLALAKNEREKEVLWHLLGTYADPIRGMREIAAINPNSDLLPLLLVRAVNIAENNIVVNPLYGSYEYDRTELIDEETEDSQFTVDPLFSWNAVRKEQLESLIEIINKIAQSRTEDQAIWTLSNAFLYWLNGDAYQCKIYTDKAEKQSNGNAIMEAQISINRILLAVDELTVISSNDEERIFNLINTLSTKGKISQRHENALRFVLAKMKRLYLTAENPLMAELSESDIYQYYNSEEIVRQMIDFMSDNSNSAFRKYLIGRYPVQLPELYDVLATARIYNYNFKGAQEIFSKHPMAGNTELMGNPFNHRKVDCHDCDHALPQKTKYTKRTFVDKMIELKMKGDTEKEPTERANNYFLFANGLYNMTYYGNARLVSSTAVSWDFNDYYRYSNKDENEKRYGSYYECGEALNYYLVALNLHPANEFKVKCNWMAAKCEHNMWLESDYQRDVSADFQSGVYFKLMQEKYSNTKYYKDVISECGYFCQYTNPGLETCIKNQ